MSVKITSCVFKIRMERLLNAFEEKNHPRIDRLCESYISHMHNAEVVVLSESEIDYVVEQLQYIQLLACLEVYDGACDTINQLKSWFSEVCNTRLNIINMLKNNSDYQTNKDMLGCIADLPCLVQNQIAVILEKDYHLP